MPACRLLDCARPLNTRVRETIEHLGNLQEGKAALWRYMVELLHAQGCVLVHMGRDA
jgi:hypothetical protein